MSAIAIASAGTIYFSGDLVMLDEEQVEIDKHGNGQSSINPNPKHIIFHGLLTENKQWVALTNNSLTK